MTLEGDVPRPDRRDDPVPLVGADAPSPEPRPPSVVRAEIAHRPAWLALLGHALTMALDALDVAGDAVAERLGLREAAGKPPS